MNLRFIQAAWCCFFLVPFAAEAMRPHVKLSNIKHSGNGCPPGSVSTTMTPDKGAINSVFDEFFTSFSGKPNQQVRRCKLSMKIRVPENKRIRLRQVRFRGFVELPYNAHARMERNYRFDNHTKQLLSTIRGHRGGAFEIIDRSEAFYTPWSKCGKDVALEVDSMIELKSGSIESAQLGIDSFNNLISQRYRGERGWKFRLHYAPC